MSRMRIANTLSVIVAAGASVVACTLGGAPATGQEQLRHPDRVFTEQTGQPVHIGWEACRWRVAYGARGNLLVTALANGYELSQDEAEQVARVSGEVLCPGSVPSSNL